MMNAHTCLAEIEALEGAQSSENRRQVLNRVADLFLLTADRQAQGDVAAFGTVMERIAYELEVEARAELSGRLCENDRAPRQLVCRLATDEILVARPVLEKSPVLNDEDLIEIANTRGQGHLHAISRRPALSSPVTDAIVARGEEDVLVEVTRNSGAEFSQSGLNTLTQKARGGGELLAALGSRSDLPPDVMGEIKARVAMRIKAEMGSSASPAQVSNVEALIDRTAADLDIDGLKRSNDKLEDKARNHKLTEDHILALIRSGKLTETVQALAVLTGLDSRIVSHCFLKADIAALGILCKANNFKPQTYLSFLKTRSGKNGIDARTIARAMRDYDAMSTSGAMRTLRFLKVRKTVGDSGESTSDSENRSK